jgi:hypothetical protein
VSDQILTFEPSIVLTVPFSNSSFQIGDTLNWLDYKETVQVNGRTSNEVFADLDLNFSTFDELELSARNINGVAETTEFDPGGATTFNGNAYKLHNEAASISREINGKRGYRVRLARNVLKFDPNQTDVNFFNYSGFDGEVAFLQPLSSNTRLSFGYLGSRYDHYNTEANFNGNGLSQYDVARTEQGDVFYATIEGNLGPRQPYRVQVGWEWLGFGGVEAAGGNYSGIVLQASSSFIVGGGTILALAAVRQPYRSFFPGNNFYVFNMVGFSAQRTFPHGTTLGATVNLSQSGYQAPVPPGYRGVGIVRSDRAIFAEAYANLAIRERVAFRISVRENVKASNYPGADYDDLVVFGGFVLGWF